MERRTFLRWAVHGLGAVFAAVVGVPAAVYLIDPRNRPARERDYRRVARLSELSVGVPHEVVIREDVRDAWTLQPDEVVGRVWLVLREERDAQGNPRVDAYSATCPHLGCSINCTGSEFLCPCHGGRFTLTGARVQPLASNPAPRDMDNLQDSPGQTNPRLVPIADNPGGARDFWVEVKFRKFKTNQPQKEDLI
jgi:Rieske Fe-S protein